MEMRLTYIVARVLQVAFFTGLIGCASCVVVSWISIFKDGFSDRDRADHGLMHAPVAVAKTEPKERPPMAEIRRSTSASS